MKKDDSRTGSRYRRKFTLEIPTLAPDSTEPQLAKVQILLSRLGYLADSYTTARLDDPTRTALRKFQAYHRLDQTGTTDTATVEAMVKPRCGTPIPSDFFRGIPGTDEFLFAGPNGLLIGCDLVALNPAINPLKYTIATSPNELPKEANLDFDEVSNAIERAFATWASKARVSFEHAPGTPNANFSFKWATGSHGDGNANKFDDIGGLFAHAFYPKKCGGLFSGQCHFDRAERWGLEHNDLQRQRDLETVSLHEIGHLLGLVHSIQPGSIMHEDYHGEHRTLEDTDEAVSAIQGLYGAA